MRINGRATGGNATVPNDASILPVQVWVEYIEKYTIFIDYPDLVNEGVTHLSPSLVARYAASYVLVNGGFLPLNYSGNAIPSADIDGILSAMASEVGSLAGGSLNFSGGTNAAPTKQDVASYMGADTYNRFGNTNGHPDYNGDLGHFQWDGSQWALMDGETVIDIATSGEAAFPWLATGWSSPVTQAKNAGQLTLEANGWTVTTN